MCVCLYSHMHGSNIQSQTATVTVKTVNGRFIHVYILYVHIYTNSTYIHTFLTESVCVCVSTHICMVLTYSHKLLLSLLRLSMVGSYMSIYYMYTSTLTVHIYIHSSQRVCVCLYSHMHDSSGTPFIKQTIVTPEKLRLQFQSIKSSNSSLSISQFPTTSAEV